MTHQEALRYIHSLRHNPGHPNLDHIRALLSAMGNPQNAYRCIHVAGTNGKGSFCAMADSVLRAAGYRTGLFTSPFIREFEERIRVDGYDGCSSGWKAVLSFTDSSSNPDGM